MHVPADVHAVYKMASLILANTRAWPILSIGEFGVGFSQNDWSGIFGVGPKELGFKHSIYKVYEFSNFH